MVVGIAKKVCPPLHLLLCYQEQSAISIQFGDYSFYRIESLLTILTFAIHSVNTHRAACYGAGARAGC
jgi:hypothetical protein